MKKLLVAGGAVVLVAAAILAVKQFQCKEPSEFTVTMTQLNCAQNANVEEVRSAICKELKRGFDCELTVDDMDTIARIFNKAIDKCAKASLEASNLCTENYKDL